MTFEKCRLNGCPGCLGIALTCGHSFPCVLDPAFGSHRCASLWLPLTQALFLASVAFAVVVYLAR